MSLMTSFGPSMTSLMTFSVPENVIDDIVRAINDTIDDILEGGPPHIVLQGSHQMTSSMTFWAPENVIDDIVRGIDDIIDDV